MIIDHVDRRTVRSALGLEQTVGQVEGRFTSTR